MQDIYIKENAFLLREYENVEIELKDRNSIPLSNIQKRNSTWSRDVDEDNFFFIISAHKSLWTLNVNFAFLRKSINNFD